METSTTVTDCSNKRPRSASFGDIPPPPSKAAKTLPNHLQINYLARQYNENIPLVNAEDTLPSILRLIGDYDGVLHRHESIAGNLGACPLGPILIRRFERLFDGPPRILKCHGKETTVTWLDVVEFARSKPEQFNLEKMRNGVRVCQFYTKQSRVEISEEDYVLIASGMPQKLIPPQPIMEDEEKELGALEILEKNLGQIISLADQVSARARQLNHRLKNRKAAIISRRESEATTGRPYIPPSYSPPPSDDHLNGQLGQNGSTGSTQSPPAGFTAVNISTEAAGDGAIGTGAANTTKPFMFSHANPDNVTIINGTNLKGVSPETKNELLKKFFTTADRDARSVLAQAEEEQRRMSFGATRPSPSTRAKSGSADYNTLFLNSPATVAIPSTPASLLPHLKPTQAERDDGGPYKQEMVSRMEQLHRGERIQPPCDRCRRLHMDCLKNLTACMGCTKKHAKCSWKDVREEELREHRTPNDEVELMMTHESIRSLEQYERHSTHGPVSEHEMHDAPPSSHADSGSILHTASDHQYPQQQQQQQHQPPQPTSNNHTYDAEEDLTRAILEEKDDPAPAAAQSEPSKPTAAQSTAPQELSIEQQLVEAAAAASAHVQEHSKDENSNGNGNGNGFQYNDVTGESYRPPRPQSHGQYTPRPDYTYQKMRVDARGGDDTDSDDEGDRLQKAAQEVYRSASTRPST